MIKDNILIKIIAGSGGNGSVNFGPNQLPQGGDGGRGGDVYLESRRSYFDFSHLKIQKPYSANNGVAGGKKNCTGADADDLVIYVPIVTEIYDENNSPLYRLSREGQRVRIAKGGIGGFGNHHFKRLGEAGLRKFTWGEKGEEINIRLVLKLMADIALIGLPNAGKSSLLNALTNANSKVGDYPFTTLNPHLGILSTKATLIDLPGLIEGTSKGKGLGGGFIQHTQSVRQIWHCISNESIDPLSDYHLIRNELLEMDPSIAKLMEIVVLTKSDLVSSEILEKNISLFPKSTIVIPVTIIDDDCLKKLEGEALKQRNQN